jgi:hypothetical protein
MTTGLGALPKTSLVRIRILPAIYTVAELPNDGRTGEMLFATNGRKPGEGASTGTGAPVVWMTPAGGGSEDGCRMDDFSVVVA